jgi:hypothetical protein
MQWIMCLGCIFAGLTIINRVMAGTFITAVDASIINAASVFREVSVFGLFTLPVPNTSYITEGIPQLLRWNYSFFGGNAAIFKFFLDSTFLLGVTFLIFTLIIGLLYNYFGKAS